MLGFHVVTALQLAHDPFIVVILTQHNNPWGGLIFMDFCLFNLVIFTCSWNCSDGFKDTEWVREWAAGLCISVLPECFCCRITKCIYFNCTGNGTHQCLDTAPVAFLATGCLIIMSWFSFGTQLCRSPHQQGEYRWSSMSLQLFFNKFIKILKSGLILFCLAFWGRVCCYWFGFYCVGRGAFLFCFLWSELAL